MQFVQALLTDEQALLTRLAVDLVLGDPERFVMTDEERQDFERLAVFYGALASTPAAFPPTGRLAQSVKAAVRKARGPAQPASQRNKRKARQERRQGYAKRRRQAQKEFTAAYNAAREEWEQQLAQEAQQEAALAEQYAAEPKVMVVSAEGTPILVGIPASMVVPMPSEEQPAPAAPEIILPDSVQLD